MSGQHVVVIGAGIVGAAIGRAVALSRPDASVSILEKEPHPGQHQTSRNSGVVHAGLYYQPGSDKARLAREGVRRLRAYCRDRGLPFLEVGKLVVALTREDDQRLAAIHERALANGVPGLRRLSATELTEIEPHVRGLSGLHSPTTAIVDFTAVAAAFLADARAAGAQLRTGFEVADIGRVPGALAGPVRLTSTEGEVVHADQVVIAAGLHADRLARLAGDSPYPRIVPFRGEFHALRPRARHLVTGLIYPVPDPRYPFLGVHLTKRVDGGVLLGPNAVLALAREGYRRRDLDADGIRALLSNPGFRAFARANVATGARELWGSLNRWAFIAAARRFVPEIRARDVVRGPVGIRAQAMDQDGTLVDDFRFSRVGPIFCVRNAPSPAATASLAIADLVLDRLDLR